MQNTIFEALDSAGDGLVVDQVDGLAEIRVKFGTHRLAAILEGEDARELGRALSKRFHSPAPKLRAIDGGRGV